MYKFIQHLTYLKFKNKIDSFCIRLSESTTTIFTADVVKCTYGHYIIVPVMKSN